MRHEKPTFTKNKTTIDQNITAYKIEYNYYTIS